MSKARNAQSARLIASQRFARWRRTRRLVLLALLVVTGSVVPGFVGRSDDWTTFDRHVVTVRQVLSGDEIGVQAKNSHRMTRVRLIGVAAPHGAERWAAESQKALANRVEGRDVTLRLEPTQTRGSDDALLAYVYLAGADNLNIKMIDDGSAYADPRISHSLETQFGQAESDARKKTRALWRGLKDEQMPAWRQQWLADRRSQKRAASPAKKTDGNAKAHP